MVFEEKMGKYEILMVFRSINGDRPWRPNVAISNRLASRFDDDQAEGQSVTKFLTNHLKREIKEKWSPGGERRNFCRS